MDFDDLAEGWELVQLASLTSEGTIWGRTRANKLLAFLQLNGFPVPIRFKNIQMGPASFDVDERGRTAQAQGLMLLEKNEGRAGFLRHDYHVTDQGRAYVQAKILPAIQQHPRADLYIDALMGTAQEYLYLKNDELVKTIHRILHLDDRDELIQTFEETRDTLQGWSEKLESGGSDPVNLAAAGAVELALMAMDQIHPMLKEEGTDDAGPFHVLYNCERLARLLNTLGSIHGGRHSRDKTIVKQIDRILNSLEVNCRIYDILEVPTDEEIDDMFEEAASFVPDRTDDSFEEPEGKKQGNKLNARERTKIQRLQETVDLRPHLLEVMAAYRYLRKRGDSETRAIGLIKKSKPFISERDIAIGVSKCKRIFPEITPDDVASLEEEMAPWEQAASEDER